MIARNYAIIPEPQPEGGLTVCFRALPEIVAGGDTETDMKSGTLRGLTVEEFRALL